ncbi:hypothetical protein BLSTO_05653 [Blastocystis sp. subtype 1]
MQSVLHDRCASWQPFAPISYHTNDTTGNPYTCVKVVDEKNIMRGMIATDMLISAAEGVLSSYLALTLFIIKTRAGLVIPWKRYATLFWQMLYFSPRHQKLAAMILQHIIPTTGYIPPVFEQGPRDCEAAEGSPEAESISKNPLLNRPVFPSDAECVANAQPGSVTASAGVGGAVSATASSTEKTTATPAEKAATTPAEKTTATPAEKTITTPSAEKTPTPPTVENMLEAKREAFVYFLLHLASHTDACPGALVGERTSCALCCNFFPFIFNTISRASPCHGLPNKEAFVEELLTTHQKVFVSTCRMHIRPDGHTAAFCSLVFAEEVVYLLRLMMGQSLWRGTMNRVFLDVLQYAAAALEKESHTEEGSSRHGGFHVVLRQRSPWFCLLTAVLKVLGAITPRMYAGCRIRIHECRR